MTLKKNKNRMKKGKKTFSLTHYYTSMRFVIFTMCTFFINHLFRHLLFSLLFQFMCIEFSPFFSGRRKRRRKKREETIGLFTLSLITSSLSLSSMQTHKERHLPTQPSVWDRCFLFGNNLRAPPPPLFGKMSPARTQNRILFCVGG